MTSTPSSASCAGDLAASRPGSCWQPGRLLAVAQRGVEDDHAFGHGSPIGSSVQGDCG
ncbi:MAG: hypothetical protein MZV70_10615 [Desulfobacterales bacterium]|nr:hypothetical protein [Desulfobacterales bacterium]